MTTARLKTSSTRGLSPRPAGERSAIRARRRPRHAASRVVKCPPQAHDALDAAVAAAYGWSDYTPAMPDNEILRRLLALNLERAGAR